MSSHDFVRQQLFELHYGLLDDDEAAAWRLRIATDADVAREWAEVLRAAGLMAQAARLEGVPLRVGEPGGVSPRSGPMPVESPGADATRLAGPTVGLPPDLVPPVRLPAKPVAAPSRRSRAPGWLLASVAIVAIVSFGFAFTRFTSTTSLFPQVMVRLEADSQSVSPGASPQRFVFRTSRHRGGPVHAQFALSVRTPQATLFQTTTATDAKGQLEFTLPTGLNVPRQASLVVRATAKDGSLYDAVADLPLDPTRFLTCLTTDKPLYRPGETVHYRSLTLERQSLRADVDLPVHFELLDPSGATVASSAREGVTQRGVGNGDFLLPQSTIGGEYTLVARSLDSSFPEERRTFLVRAYRTPRFKKDLEFRRDSYGPGDTVEADFALARIEGGPLANTPLTMRVTVDGREVFFKQDGLRTSETGTLVLSFPLPQHIDQGDGQLALLVDDGGTRETFVKPIPIHVGKVHVDFYPEGGDLTADLPNRVYFAARNPLGKPIDIEGQVLDESGRKVAELKTIRDGLGRFELQPRMGTRYTLKITRPLDVTNSPELPAVVASPLVLNTGRGVFGATEPIRFTITPLIPPTRNFGEPVGVSPRTSVGASGPGADAHRLAEVTAHCRGRLVGQNKLTLTNGLSPIAMKIDNSASGVIRLTVSDSATGRPIAERLVYRRSDRKLNVRVVEPMSDVRSPGEPARLTLQVTDEKGQPAPGVLGVSVVDEGVLSMADRKLPSLSTHFLLTSEVHDPKNLEDADFYLADDDPAAAESLDLLLGTQGWRRFVDRTAARSAPEASFAEQVQRLVELDGVASPPRHIDNAAAIEQQLRIHAEARGRELGEFLLVCCLIAIPVLGVWGITVLLRRLPLNASAGMWLVLAASLPTVVIIGCGESSSAPKATAPSASKPVIRRAEGASEVASFAMSAPQDDESRPSQTEPVDPSSAKATSAPVIFGELKGIGDKYDDDAGKTRRAMTGNLAGLPHRGPLTRDELRQLLTARGVDADRLADKLLQELRFPVREYAHRHVRRDPAVRDDFTETIYWHPLLITDGDGRATIQFHLSDAVTTFRVLADAHGADGRLGGGGGEVRSRLPFQLEPKLPLEVTVGDRIELPVAVINNRDEALPVELEVTADPIQILKPLQESRRTLDLPAGSRRREHFAWDVQMPDRAEMRAVVQVRGSAGSLSDAVRRELRVASAGYPVRESHSGVIAETERLRLRVPESAVPGSLAVTLRAYPSPLADLLAGVDSMLSEPHGCFEQATASNYPNTLALRYLQQNQQANPEVTRRAKEMLDRGYKRLTGYECRQKGYEWFGKDPGHEALTAFGLMQFRDMRAVFEVDEGMLARTLAWLVGRRDGQGSFQRNPRHLHAWSVRQELVDAYILWALTEAGETNLAPELNRLLGTAETSDDAYLLALSAAALLNAKRTDDGERLLAKLVPLQAADGRLTGRQSIVQSGGLSLSMETTALAALAWLKSPRYVSQANLAVTWIVRNRQGHGGFGSTQATVLCLKALVTHAEKGARTRHGGTLSVLRLGQIIAEVPLPAGEAKTVELTGLGQHLAVGESELELRAPGYGRLPYSLDVTYHTTSPPSDPACPIRLATSLDRTELRAGETTILNAVVRNNSADGQPMTVAILGLPGGLEPQTEQLTALREAGTIDYYELRPRELIFYWRTLPPSAETSFQLTLTAAIPGNYTGPASRCYLYYTAEQKTWVEPLRVKIARE